MELMVFCLNIFIGINAYIDENKEVIVTRKRLYYASSISNTLYFTSFNYVS